MTCGTRVFFYGGDRHGRISGTGTVSGTVGGADGEHQRGQGVPG